MGRVKCSAERETDRHSLANMKHDAGIARSSAGVVQE